VVGEGKSNGKTVRVISGEKQVKPGYRIRKSWFEGGSNWEKNILRPPHLILSEKCGKNLKKYEGGILILKSL